MPGPLSVTLSDRRRPGRSGCPARRRGRLRAGRRSRPCRPGCAWPRCSAGWRAPDAGAGRRPERRLAPRAAPAATGGRPAATLASLVASMPSRVMSTGSLASGRPASSRASSSSSSTSTLIRADSDSTRLSACATSSGERTGMPAGQLGVAADGGKRRAQLVAGVGGEAAQPCTRSPRAARARTSTWPSIRLNAAPTWPTSVRRVGVRDALGQADLAAGQRQLRSPLVAVAATRRSGRSETRTQAVPMMPVSTSAAEKTAISASATSRSVVVTGGQRHAGHDEAVLRAARHDLVIAVGGQLYRPRAVELPAAGQAGLGQAREQRLVGGGELADVGVARFAASRVPPEAEHGIDGVGALLLSTRPRTWAARRLPVRPGHRPANPAEVPAGSPRTAGSRTKAAR